MPIEVTMPKLTDTMDEGKIVRWLKQVGEHVDAGEILAEVETDKADMELEAEKDGIVSEIRVAEGAIAAVGAVIAVLGAPNETVAKPVGDAKAAPAKPVMKPTPVVEPVIAAPAPAVTAAPKPSAVPQATPLARRAAEHGNVELKDVAGTGARGRVTQRDVVAVPATAEAPAANAAEPVRTPTGRVELSKMRQTIARRMAESSRVAPHFYVTSEIDMGEALRIRKSLEATGMLSEPVTVTHLLIKAVALALQRHPRVNAAWADNALTFSEAINIGIATAVEDGLLVPVLKGCEQLSLAQIAAGARALHEKSRGGRFTAEEMVGGTFTISNMGMLDVDEFTAIINTPQAAILAVGAIKERAVVRAGQVTVGQTMRVTLSCDHRILNGVEGARFLEELKRLLENPVVLVMG